MTSSKAKTMSTDLRVCAFASRRRSPVDAEAEKLARKHEIFAQQIEAAKRPGRRWGTAARPRRSRSAKRIRPGARNRDRVAETVEIAEYDADAVARRSARTARPRLPPAPARCIGSSSVRQPANQNVGIARCRDVAISRPRVGRSRGGSAEIRSPAWTSGPTGTPSACRGAGVGNIRAATISNGQSDDVGRQAETAGHQPVTLAIGRIEIGAARDRSALAQRRDRRRRAHRRPASPTASARDNGERAVRAGCCDEFRKFVLQLQLHARRKKGRAFQQARDHRVGAVARPVRPVVSAMPGYSSANSPRLFLEDLTARDCSGPEIPDPSALAAIQRDVAAREIDVRDEFDRNIDRMADQLRGDDEAQFERILVGRVVPSHRDRTRIEPGLISLQGAPDLFRDLGQPEFVDGAMGDVRKTVVEDRTRARARRPRDLPPIPARSNSSAFQDRVRPRAATAPR